MSERSPDDDNNEFEDEPQDEDPWEGCGLGDDGQCSMAGSEHCDFSCPMRDSEFFAGGKEWKAKHKRRRS